MQKTEPIAENHITITRPPFLRRNAFYGEKEFPKGNQKTDSLINHPVFSHRNLDFVQRRLPVHAGRRNHYDCRIAFVDDLLSPKKPMES